MRKLLVGIAALAMFGLAGPALAGLTFETGQGVNGSSPSDPTADYPGLIGTKPVIGGGQADTSGGGVFVQIGHESDEDPFRGSPNPGWGRVAVNVSPDNGVQVYAEDYMTHNNKAELVDALHRLLGCPFGACPNPWVPSDDAILISLVP